MDWTLDACAYDVGSDRGGKAEKWKRMEAQHVMTRVSLMSLCIATRDPNEQVSV